MSYSISLDPLGSNHDQPPEESQFNERLKVLYGRDMFVFPDMNGYNEWCEKVKAFINKEYQDEVLALIEDLDLEILQKRRKTKICDAHGLSSLAFLGLF